MPLPLLLALTAASMGANYAGQKKVDKARRRTLAEDIVRRSKLQDQSAASAANTADLFTGTAKKEQANAAAREAAAAPPAAGAPAVPAAALDTFAPTDSAVTIDENQRQAALSRDKLGQVGRARAGLEDFGNIMSGQSQAVARNAQDQAAAITSGNSWAQNVMPFKMAQASAAGRDMFTLADMIQLAASIYAPHALSTGGAAAGKGAEEIATARFGGFGRGLPGGSIPFGTY